MLRVVVLAAALTSASAPVAAQGSPMLWAEYRAAAQAAVDDLARPRSSPGPFSIESLREGMDAALARWEVEYARLSAIAPEECYAAAHAEYLAFRHDELANYRDAIPMLMAAESQMGVLAISLMVQGLLAEAHPLAFPEVPPEAGVVTLGPKLDAMHIIDALQTCEPQETPGATAPTSSLPAGAPLVTMSYIDGKAVWPERDLPPGDYRADWTSGCQVAASIQGATVVTTNDPPAGSRIFTIEPNHSGTTMTTMCPAGASVVVEVRAAE